MKSFRRYVIESPHETDQPVTVSLYLPQAPRPDWTARAQKLFAAVRDGRLNTVDSCSAIASLIPTQATVSSIKVMDYAHDNGTATLAPLVWHREDGIFILDGHHRICGKAVKGELALITRNLDPTQHDAIASILEN